MKGKLFCEISPQTYKISIGKERLKRHLKNMVNHKTLAKDKTSKSLDYKVYKHKSLLLRKLGNSDLSLQINKKKTLQLVAPRLDGILIHPKETFSFWHIVGPCKKKQGFKDGVIISKGRLSQGIGGGMCQMTNLIHWMVLHSPLEVTEHHHHHSYDMFPDFNRQVPFGTGTSIMYNYLDYGFYNPTDQVFQLKLHVSDKYLEGQLLTDAPLDYAYHIKEANHGFYKKDDCYYRCNEISVRVVDKSTGLTLEERLIIKNNSQVMYAPSLIPKDQLIDKPKE